MKTQERERARQLRRDEGLPINEIARRLRVAKSSVSLWVRDIELTDEQHARLRALNPAYNRQLNGSRTIAERHRANRRRAQEHGRALARRAEPLHVLGCMLYWGEGGKRPPYRVCFSNTDPEMIRLFVAFLRAYFDISDGDIRIKCHLFADHVERQREIERYWLSVAGLPPGSLRKSVVNVYSRSSKRKRVNKLPNGTCQVILSRVHVVQSILGSIQEYGGFTRPEWLELDTHA
jgi:transcriptional regulator with XRE-family HTH domain